MALGGAGGLVKSALSQFTGLGNLVDKGVEIAVVGGDALLRRDSFGQVLVENRDKSASNPTFNQTTGIAVIGSTVAAAVTGGVKLTRTDANAPPPKNGAKTCSFDGDTLVRTLMGFFRIKDLRAGSDQVWARDPKTGAMGYRLVEAQYSNTYDVTVRVTINDADDGRTQTIVSNKIHPFFVQLPEGASPARSSEGHRYDGTIARGAWVDASELKAGYRLLNDDGSWAVVGGVTVERAPLTVYNLKVSGFHTYFSTLWARR